MCVWNYFFIYFPNDNWTLSYQGINIPELLAQHLAAPTKAKHSLSRIRTRMEFNVNNLFHFILSKVERTTDNCASIIITYYKFIRLTSCKMTSAMNTSFFVCCAAFVVFYLCCCGSCRRRHHSRSFIFLFLFHLFRPSDFSGHQVWAEQMRFLLLRYDFLSRCS